MSNSNNQENDVYDLAIQLMSDHDLLINGWTFQFDNAKKRLGLCRHNTKCISMSRYFVSAATADEVEQTLLHEIAHARLPTHNARGKRIGHGPEWRRLARSIGYKGDRISANPYVAKKLGPSAVIIPDPTIRRGDIVAMSNGLTAIVIKRAVKRYQLLTEDGRTYSSPFEITTRSTTASQQTVDTLRSNLRQMGGASIPSPTLHIGDTGKLTIGGAHRGKSVIVVGVGSARYKVKFTDSGKVYFR